MMKTSPVFVLTFVYGTVGAEAKATSEMRSAPEVLWSNLNWTERMSDEVNAREGVEREAHRVQ